MKKHCRTLQMVPSSSAHLLPRLPLLLPDAAAEHAAAACSSGMLREAQG